MNYTYRTLRSIWLSTLPCIEFEETRQFCIQNCILLELRNDRLRIGFASQEAFENARFVIDEIEAAFAKRWSRRFWVSLEVLRPTGGDC